MQDPFLFDSAFEDEQPDIAGWQLENDLLKLKMQAEYGAVFTTSEELPPAVERAFLQNVMAFEALGKNAPRIAVYDLIGRPLFKPSAELTAEDAPRALEEMINLLEANDLSLVMLYDYPPLLIYTFITEELFFEEIEDISMPGMLGVFVYENFHPKHAALIEELTTAFLEGWRNLHWEDLNNLLYYVGVLPNDEVIKEEEMLRIIEREKQRYDALQLFEFNIEHIQFEWKEGNVGLGFSEGQLKTMAMPRQGLPAYLSGEFRVYFCNTDGYWRITFFYMPGFDWN
jgi:hypothetical protein